VSTIRAPWERAVRSDSGAGADKGWSGAAAIWLPPVSEERGNEEQGNEEQDAKEF